MKNQENTELKGGEIAEEKIKSSENLNNLEVEEKMKEYKVLDLFAGCGGLSKGFELAGFNVVAGNDILDHAGETYKRNHPNSKFFLGDITDEEMKKQIISYMKEKGCDVIIGGPPCQAYSMAGLRDSKDPRGRLFEEYVEIVKELQPKVFVMENVKGILTIKHDRDNLTDEEKKELEELRNAEKERADLLLLRKQHKNNSEKYKYTEEDERRLEEIKEEVKRLKDHLGDYQEKVTDKIVRRFNGLGYDVKFKLLNSANYGVPQKRERVIFIGKKKNGKITHPEPTHSEKGENGLKKWVSIKEAIGDLEDKEEDINFNHIITNHNEEFTEKIKKTPIGKSVFGNYSDAFFKAYPDQPSRTVKENHGGVFVHYKHNRVMTPRELARLQSFPDDFIFEGSKSKQLVQIGNAVPVGLAKAIAEHIKKLID
jgi:DNA (cytosine-5)-methyltransferase 1